MRHNGNEENDDARQITPQEKRDDAPRWNLIYLLVLIYTALLITALWISSRYFSSFNE
ncbi:MAG: hypothetical protein H0V27_01290 [Pyrinomonadaceae bacterium]|nr:hypothetical protein [Pyrinomonadaceae bacterium]